MEEMRKLLDTCVEKALDAVYEKDAYLLAHRIHERAIVFRFGYYLQNMINQSEVLREYDLDFEYNRNGRDLKRLEYTNQNGSFPDLVLHKRGSNEHNLLVIEFKPYWNTRYSRDYDKLRQFTDTDGQYRYLCGKFIRLGETRQEVHIVEFPQVQKRRNCRNR